MTENKANVDKLTILRPKLRIGLLALQVLLPLIGYAGLQAGNTGLTVGIAVTFVLSLVVLIWLG
jgi:hypothetical protein